MKINFILVKPEGDKFRRMNDNIYVTTDSLKAAKKAFRSNKHLERIYVCNLETKIVHSFLTSSFFKDKRKTWK